MPLEEINGKGLPTETLISSRNSGVMSGEPRRGVTMGIKTEITTTTGLNQAGRLLLPTLVLMLGVFACSTAVIMIKASASHPIVLSAYRLLIASAVLTPVFLHALRGQGAVYRPEHLRRSFIPAVFLAAHFISWAVGGRMTYAANAVLIVNMVPLVMPFILVVLLRERVHGREIAGTVLALAGVFLIGVSDYRLDPQLLYGDFVCFASMLLFAIYLALGRRNRDFSNVWLYLIPLYWMAGLICLLAALILRLPLTGFSGAEYALLAGLALVPTIVGHSILNYSLKHFRGQVVSVVNLLQFVFAGAMAYFIFSEVPKPAFYAAALLVGIGAWVVLRRK